MPPKKERSIRERAEILANKIMMDGRLRQGSSVDTIEQFAQELIAETKVQERERAAKVCEESVKPSPLGNWNECTKTPFELAQAIRDLK